MLNVVDTFTGTLPAITTRSTCELGRAFGNSHSKLGYQYIPCRYISADDMYRSCDEVLRPGEA
jgi:hypothetical protein